MAQTNDESLAVRVANKCIENGARWLIIAIGIILGIIGLAMSLAR